LYFKIYLKDRRGMPPPSLVGNYPMPLEVPSSVLASIFSSGPDQEASGAPEEGRQANQPTVDDPVEELEREVRLLIVEVDQPAPCWYPTITASAGANMNMQDQKRPPNSGWTTQAPLPISSAILREASSPIRTCRQNAVSGTIRTMHLTGCAIAVIYKSTTPTVQVSQSASRELRTLDCVIVFYALLLFYLLPCFWQRQRQPACGTICECETERMKETERERARATERAVARMRESDRESERCSRFIACVQMKVRMNI